MSGKANPRSHAAWAGMVPGKVSLARSCRWCRKPLPSRRNSLCSDQCVHEYLIAYHTGYMRSLVYERDHGVCQSCGLDTDELARAREKVQKMPHRSRAQIQAQTDATYLLSEEFAYKNLPPWLAHKERSLWDADHIIPVAQGGIRLGLDNIRTLCVGCHQKVTKKFAQERAQQKRR